MNAFFEGMMKVAFDPIGLAAKGAKKGIEVARDATGAALKGGANLAHKALYVPNGKGGTRLSLKRTAAVGAAGYLGLRAIKANSEYQHKLSRDYGENRNPSGINPTFGAGK